MEERAASNRICLIAALLLGALIAVAAMSAGCSPTGAMGRSSTAASSSASAGGLLDSSGASSGPIAPAASSSMASVLDKNKPQSSGGVAQEAASSDAGASEAGASDALAQSSHASSGAGVPESRPDANRDIRALPAGEVVSAREIEAYGEDACFTVEEIDDEVFARMWGNSYGADCTVPREDLRYIRVLHADAEGAIHVGELVMNAALAQEVCDIFHELYHAAYPIEKMHLVDDYGGDDNASMADNNTSSFNFRTVPGSSNLSNHAYGRAIDINPYYNPYVPSPHTIMPDGTWQYADRSWSWTYKIEEGDLCHRLFLEHGFTWGGYWSAPDYQHFTK